MLPVVHRTWVFVMQLAVNWQDGICPCVAENDDSPQKFATEFVIDLFDVFENAHLQVGHKSMDVGVRDNSEQSRPIDPEKSVPFNVIVQPRLRTDKRHSANVHGENDE